jgi:aldose 1-epimerase
MPEHSAHAAMTSSPVPPTGEQYEIGAGDLRAVVTEVGAGLRTLTVGGRHLVAGFAADAPPTGGAGQLLAPWPNRVGDGSYAFDGQRQQLDLSEPARGNAIHGLVRWLPWRLVRHDTSSVELTVRVHHRPGYPHVIDLTARYELADDGLTVTVTARNVGASAAPYGVGAHPYLRAGDGPVDDWTLRLAARRRLVVDDRMLPAGEEDVAGTEYDFAGGRKIGGTVLDHAFTGLARDADDVAEARLTAPDGRGVALRLGPGLGWIQLFTGDALPPERRRQAVAVEPMSCPPDALRGGAGVIRLEPGAEVSHWWRIAAI